MVMISDPTSRGHRAYEYELPAPRILIVDDEIHQASSIKRALRDSTSVIGRLKCEIDAADDLITARQYLAEDSIDIYILDLKLSEKAGEGPSDISVGKDFVADVSRGTNAGIVVYSTFPAETESSALLETGADDYIEKTSSPDIIAARVLSVWRRTIQSRATESKSIKLAHVGRTFDLNGWQFTIGERILTNIDGAKIKITATEHAFLRYLVAIEDHTIDGETFNIDVLDRDRYKTPVRLDNFVYRLRKKISDRIQIVSQGAGRYKLLDVKELKPRL
jgi:DNA-binding response OmpR family regulator